MSGFSINKNGKLQTWTPYFDFKHMEQSLELPFPDGIIRVSNDKKPLTFNKKAYNAMKINEYVNDKLFGAETSLTEFKEFVDFLNEIQNEKYIPTKGLYDNTKKYIESYFTNVVTDKTRLLDSSKNAAMGALYKISNAPVNMMSSNRGVDMDAPKAGAKKSPKAWDAMQMSMDNYATLPLMKEENGAGKAVIGISAVGIKVFYGLGHVQNQKLIELENTYRQEETFTELLKSNPEQAQVIINDFIKLASPKVIDFIDENGKSHKVLTNLIANANLYNTQFMNSVYDYMIASWESEYGEDVKILDVRRMDDYSLTLSSLLSAATDNAKELLLAKINAGPELAGTYIYMLLQGIDFDTITTFMVSPTVDAIVKKSKSNIFNDDFSNIDKAINYYLEGVPIGEYLNKDQYDTLGYHIWNKKTDFFKLMDQEGQKHFTNDKGDIKMFVFNLPKYLKHVVVNDKTEEFVDLVYKTFPKGAKGEFSSASEKISFDQDFYYNGFDDDTYSANSNKPLTRFLNEMIERDYELGTSVHYDKVKEFAQLYLESQEITNLGRRLGINGGMGTDFYSHYSFNQDVSNYFCKKVVKMDPKKFEEITKTPFTPENINRYTDLSNFHKNVDTNNETDLISHKVYQDEVIALYEAVKDKYNIIQVEKEAPHYNAMLGAYTLATELFTGVSVNYEYTKKIMDELIARGHVTNFNDVNHKFSEDDCKKISNFILSDLVNKFMNNADIEFNVPSGNYYYDSRNNFTIAESDVKLNLNTVNGRMSFKLFMDNNKDSLNEISNITEGNEFIDNLVTDIKKDPITSEEYEFIKLDIDLNNIKSDVDQIQFQEMSNGFRYLKSKSFNPLPGKSVADAFFLYNLIVNNNSFGKTSFTKIFENDLVPGETNIISEFFKFVGDVDYSKFTKVGSIYSLDVDYDYISKLIAPTKTEYDYLGNFQGEYIKKWNNREKRYVFYKYSEKLNGDKKTGGYDQVKDSKEFNNIPSHIYGIKQVTDVDYDVNVENAINTKGVIDMLISEHENGNIKILIKC